MQIVTSTHKIDAYMTHTQNNILLQDLVNNKDDIERQLKEKTEELFHVYQQVADLMEEKKVLMDIIHQLCLEAGKQIDVV